MCDDPFYETSSSKTFSSILPAPADYTKHLCTKKCEAGCIGSTCFCDGFEDTDVKTYVADDGTHSSSGPLCLDATMCREACDAAGAGCAGYQTHTATNRCFL